MSLLEQTIKKFGPIHKDKMTWAEFKACVESTGVEGADIVRASLISIWSPILPSTVKAVIAFDGE